MKTAVSNFMKYRFLLWELVKKDIKLKYRRSWLGYLWTLLEPLLTMLVLYVVFSKLYGKEDPLFPVYILTGRLLYTFFANSTKAAMKSIRSNAAMIKKVYVPKYMYPLSAVISNYITFLLSLFVLVFVCIFLRVKPTIYLLQSVVPLGLIFFMSLGIGIFLATAAVFFRDLEYLWGVFLMLIMYGSAIFYTPSRVVKNGFEWIFKINPLYALILNFRNAVLDHARLDHDALIFSILFSAVSLLVGTILFYRKQDQFILNI